VQPKEKMRKGTKVGKCKLCLETKELNFEHIPPRSAFNKETKYFNVNQTEYYKKAKEYAFENLKPKSRKEQGGIGSYSFCIECNNYLGLKYVRTYKEFAHIAMSIIQSNDIKTKAFQFDISDINLLNFLKQITAIFIASNNFIFTECYPELLEFVKDENSMKLPEKYRFYMYLNNEGKNRKGNIHYTNLYGAICEFTFIPFGFVLSINNKNQLMKLTEITSFKNYDKNRKMLNSNIILNKYPTFYPFPMDYRSEKELKGST
jgi:hypothetical protein